MFVRHGHLSCSRFLEIAKTALRGLHRTHFCVSACVCIETASLQTQPNTQTEASYTFFRTVLCAVRRTTKQQQKFNTANCVLECKNEHQNKVELRSNHRPTSHSPNTQYLQHVFLQTQYTRTIDSLYSYMYVLATSTGRTL